MAFGASSGSRANNADGKIIIGTSVDMYGMNTGLKKIQKSINRLGATLGASLGLAGLINLGKAALNAASDLQEVQNVVDVSFGEMSWKIEQFADTCIEKFGMSELAAKQTAGSFMAMGKSMGLSMEDASNMAVSLTALTADFGSFYNISQDYARVAMSAVYTGETETLKRYGIVLTEANLQEYASTLGIQTKVKAMDASSKAMLRYSYIMKATADMQGDFARTSGSWANQTRLLSQQWTVFLNTLGTGLITVLTPVLKMLNSIVAAMTRFLQVIGATLSRIFGIKWQSMSVGASSAASSFEDAAEGMDNLGDSAGKAGKQVKKLLAPWDELNVISKDTASAMGGGGGAGGESIDFDIPGIEDVGGGLEDWIKSFDSLFDLGRYISKSLEDTLRNIDWDKIYAGAKAFGSGLAEFLNGLITPGLFGAVGMTIANALNTAIYAALDFATKFDWANLGTSLAQGVNEFFENFDFASLANAIDAWVQGLYKAVMTFIQDVKWEKVLDGLKEFLTNLDIDTVAIIIDVLTIKSIGKLAFGVLPALIAKGLGKAIATAWAEGGGLMGIFGEEGVLALLGAGTLPEAVTAVFGTLAGILTTIALVTASIGGAVLAVVNFFAMWEEGWDVLKTILEAIGIAIAAVAAILLGAPLAAAAAIAAKLFLISQLVVAVHDNWEGIKEIIRNIPQWVSTNVIEPVKQFFSGLWEAIASRVSGVIENVKTTIAPIVNWFRTYIIEPIKFAIEWIAAVVEAVWLIIQAGLYIIVNWINKNFIAPIKEFFTALIDGIKEKLDNAWKIIQVVLATIKTVVTTVVINPVKQKFETFITGIKNFVINAWNNIKSVLALIYSYVKVNVIDPIAKGFSSLWADIVAGVKNALNIAIAIIEGFVNGIIDSINGFTSGLSSIADKAAEITGKSFGGIPQIPRVSLPRLATGAVIPPNREFMAVLGDQKSGTNVEAPLDTIKQALAEVLSDGSTPGSTEALMRKQVELLEGILQKNVSIDSKDAFNAVRSEANSYYKRTGSAAFAM